MLVLSTTFRPLFLMLVIRIGGANDPVFRSLDSSMKDRHVGWKNPKSKFRYLEAVPEELTEVTRSMNI